jgi:hypothetical protein
MDLFERLLERLLEWLPLASHPPLSQILVVGLIVVAGLVIVVLLRPRRPKGMPAHDVRIDGLEERVAVKAQPLMNDSEVWLFNLLLLVVRDHFLLLPKIPLKSLVHLRVDDDSSKRVLAHTLRNVTVDFVAVHPGTKLPFIAIFVRKPEHDARASRSQERLVEALFQKAGIAVVRLDQEARYSVERLTNLLGLEEET